ERARVEPVRLANPLPPLRLLRRGHQRLDCALDRSRLVAATDARVLASLLEVVRDDLDHLVADAASRLHPVDEADVQARPPALGYARVRDVLDQAVLERPLALVDEARLLAAADHVAVLERLQARVDLLVAAVEVRDGARPERHPDDRGVLGSALVAGG